MNSFLLAKAERAFTNVYSSEQSGSITTEVILMNLVIMVNNNLLVFALEGK